MRKRFGDLNDLLLANAKVSNQGGGIQRLFESVQQLPGNLFLLPMLDDSPRVISRPMKMFSEMLRFGNSSSS